LTQWHWSGAVFCPACVDGVYHASVGPDRLGKTYLGKEEIRKGIKAFFERFPDGRFENLKVAGNIGWFERDFVATDASGKSVTTAGCDLLTFRGDQVVLPQGQVLILGRERSAIVVSHTREPALASRQVATIRQIIEQQGMLRNNHFRFRRSATACLAANQALFWPELRELGYWNPSYFEPRLLPIPAMLRPVT
jgi:hypothetical protein